MVQAILLVPIAIAFLILIWRVNLYRTLIFEFETDASELMQLIGEHMIEMDIKERLFAVMGDEPTEDLIGEFKRKWQTKGISVRRIDFKHSQWIQRRFELSCLYSVSDENLMWGWIVPKRENEVSIKLHARIQAPFTERRQWKALSHLATNLCYIEAPRILYRRISSIAATWLYRWLGD